MDERTRRKKGGRRKKRAADELAVIAIVPRTRQRASEEEEEEEKFGSLGEREAQQAVRQITRSGRNTPYSSRAAEYDSFSN